MTASSIMEKRQQALPGPFKQLVAMMQPKAIWNDAQNRKKLTQGQALYLERLVQLVQAYEAEHHRIDTSDLRGIDSLRHLLGENPLAWAVSMGQDTAYEFLFPLTDEELRETAAQKKRRFEQFRFIHDIHIASPQQVFPNDINIPAARAFVEFFNLLIDRPLPFQFEHQFYPLSIARRGGRRQHVTYLLVPMFGGIDMGRLPYRSL